MRGDVESAEFMDARGSFWDGAAAAHGEDAPFHFEDIVVPRNDRLVAEGIGVVDTFWEGGVDPIGEGEGLVDRIKKGECMDFFCGLDFESEEAREACAASTFGDGGGIFCGLMIGECDAVHASRKGFGDDF